MENQLALSVTQSIDVLTALGGGFLSFFSPCALPLVPIFLGILLPDISNFKSTLKRAGAFFLGLSVFFSILGTASGFLGYFLSQYQWIINIAGGIFIAVLGLLYLFEVQLFKGKAINFNKFRNNSFLSAFLMGILISFVWLPCSGPVLGAILTLAAARSSAWYGGLLLFVYSLGISLPFLFLGGLISKITSKISFGQPKWQKYLRLAGGIIMIAMGIVMMLGLFNKLQIT